MCCHYRILGLTKGASRTEIKNAYLKAVKQWHPDRYHNQTNVTECTNKLKKINAAYSVLSNEELRKRYDQNSTNVHNHNNPRRTQRQRYNSNYQAYQKYQEEMKDRWYWEPKSEFSRTRRGRGSGTGTKKDDGFSYKSWDDSKQSKTSYRPSIFESILSALLGIEFPYSTSYIFTEIINGISITTETKKYPSGTTHMKNIIVDHRTGQVEIERFINGKFQFKKIIIPAYIKV